MELENWVYFENSDKLVNISDFSVMKFEDNGWLHLVSLNGKDVFIENVVDVENFKKNVLHLGD